MRKIFLALVATMVVVGSATALSTGGVTTAQAAMAGSCDPSACDPSGCEMCPGCCGSGCSLVIGQ